MSMGPDSDHRFPSSGLMSAIHDQLLYIALMRVVISKGRSPL